MTPEQTRAAVVRALAQVAPEADPTRLDPTVPLRDQLDIDSMDFLNFAIALHKLLGVDIPEKDYPRLATLDGCVSYLAAAVPGP